MMMIIITIITDLSFLGKQKMGGTKDQEVAKRKYVERSAQYSPGIILCKANRA